MKPPAGRRTAASGRTALVLVVLVGVALSAVLFFLFRAQEDSRARLRFTTEAQECFAALERQTSDSMLALDSLAALYASSQEVDRQEFASFTGTLLGSHPEIQALEWIPQVSREARADFEAAARADGFDDFTFTERGPGGTLVTAAERDEYHPVYYLEPLAGNEAALGYDLASEQTRRETLARARDEGRARATPILSLVQTTGSSYGVLIARPLYRSGVTPPTAASRRADFYGHVLGVFVVDEVVELALKPLKREMVDLWLLEEEVGRPAVLLHFDGADPDAEPPTDEEARERLASASLTHEARLDLAGRTWLVAAAPAATTFGTRHTAQPWLALVAGLLATGAFTGYLRGLQARNVEERRHTAEILASKTTLEREVHERERVEAQLLASQRLEAVGRLAGGIAHDFNNLLTAIVASAGLLRRQGPGSGSWDQDIDEIERAAGSAASLTRQLLAFSRQQVLEPEPLDLNRVMRDVEGVFKRILGEHIRVEIRTGGGPLPIHADKGQIEQVLLNLVVNARDAMPGGGTLTITTSAEDPGGTDEGGVEPEEGRAEERRAEERWAEERWVMLSVSDDGSGIDPELMPLIFEPFVSTKDPEERSGLGLATVYGIVSQSGGTVAVESAPGHGTVFHVRLPRYEGFLPDDPGTPPAPGPLGSAARAEPTAGRSADPDSGPAAASRSEHAATILLVEDEPSVLALTRRILERHRYRVLAAASGEDALAQAEAFEGEIHLLLTDVMMPGMNGKQLAEKLAVARTGLPVLFISGYSAHIIAPEGVLETGFHFLAKPFSPESLTEKVAAILAGRTLHESRAPLPRTRGGEEP